MGGITMCDGGGSGTAMAQEVTCPDGSCSFRVRADDEHELIDIVQEHARKVHDQEFTDEQVTDLMQPG